MKHNTLAALFTGIANAIRSKGATGDIVADDFPDMIEAIKTDPVLQEKNVTPTESSQEVTADDGFEGLLKVLVDAIPSDYVIPSNPIITVSSGGLITATANGKSATQQLTTKAAATITPSSATQTAISAGTYATGPVTVAAIPSTYTKNYVWTGTLSATTSRTIGPVAWNGGTGSYYCATATFPSNVTPKFVFFISTGNDRHFGYNGASGSYSCMDSTKLSVSASATGWKSGKNYYIPTHNTKNNNFYVIMYGTYA